MNDPIQTVDEPEREQATPVAADSTPQHIGRYRVERILGKGGFGLVYLAHDEQLQRPVAVKVPHRRLVSRPEDAEAYLTEARTVAGLDHPNIVPVYDVGSTEDFPCFVVSKFIEGSTLAQRIKANRPSVAEAVQLVATVAETLHYAHRRGLIHRDIKPGNILLDAGGKPCVADFGLVLREQDVGKGPRYAGTPAYMSPEQARGEGHWVDGRSDIFSLGVVLYELLTGRRPFHADSREELVEQIANREARPPRQWDETIPKELERICLRALSKRASERYTTAKDMGDDLRHWPRPLNEGRNPAEVGPGPAEHVLEADLVAEPGLSKHVKEIAETQDHPPIQPSSRGQERSNPPISKGRRGCQLQISIVLGLLLVTIGVATTLIVYRPRPVPPVVENDPQQADRRDNSNEGARLHPVTKTEVRWDGVPDQMLAAIAAIAGELKLNAPADCQEILDRLLVKSDTDRFTAYEQLAAKLPVLVHNLKTREPLARFLTECCVHEPSDLNAANVWRALGGLFPKEGAIFNPDEKGRELEDALYARQIIFNAMTDKAVKRDRAKSLADEFGTVFEFALDTSTGPDELMVETEKLLARRCYRNTLPTASKSIEHALTMRAVLIEKFPQHLPLALRNKVDADLLVTGLGKGNAALWPKLDPIVKTCLASDDAAIRLKLIDAYTKANAELGGKMAVLLAPKWKAVASAKLTPAEQVAARHKFLNIDPNKKTSRAPAFRLLLNPVGAADEEISLGVFKALLGESNALTSEEMDVLAEAVRDVKRRTSVRCFAVNNLGEGEHVARAVPALVDVLREKGDVKLLSLSIKALGRIGDKRQDVLTPLLALAMSAAEEEIRLESLQVLEQLEPSALSTAQILDRWPAENGSSVRQELRKLLQSRLALLKPEQMNELRLVLRRKEAEIVVVGLKVVQAKKEDAADLAPEVADLLEENRPKVREASVEALQALGPAASKALPKVLEVLAQLPKYKRTSLALTVADIVDAKDTENAARFVSFLVEGLHPEALKMSGEGRATAINRVLLKIGQPAVEGIFQDIDTDSRGKDEIHYRKNLYNTLAGLGPSCRSQANYESLLRLRNKELAKKYKDVIDAARAAMVAMEPK